MKIRNKYDSINIVPQSTGNILFSILNTEKYCKECNRGETYSRIFLTKGQVKKLIKFLKEVEK